MKDKQVTKPDSPERAEEREGKLSQSKPSTAKPDVSNEANGFHWFTYDETQWRA